MTKYLISFPSSAMVLPDDEWEAVGISSRAAIEEAKAAGVYVFGGGLNEEIPAVQVTATGEVNETTYPETKVFNGGFLVLEVPTREGAVDWAAKFSLACRTTQELREFMYDPAS